MKIAITGRPKIGKTTVVEKIVNELKKRNIKVSGFITKEIKEENERVGFELINLENGKKEVLASIYVKSNVKVGKYYVNLSRFENFLKEIFDKINCREEERIIVIDEIGPMELKSKFFKLMVNDLLNKDNLIATVHYKLKSLLRNFDLTFIITYENRNYIWKEILEKVCI